MRRALFGLLAATGLAASAQAQVWAEIPDAPELIPGQITVGAGPLTNITGSLAGDADLYCILITDPFAFAAWTNGADFGGGAFAGFDSQLFLFDAGGMGMTHNDDSGSGFLSHIGAGGPGPGGFPLAPGHYWLAISAYNYDPLSPGGFIWANSPFGDETPPDGPGAPGPLSGWAGGSGGGEYNIALVGATFCEVPAPGSIALLGLGGLLAARRRR